MQNTVYVGISGQISLQRRMETIAQNMANVNTSGFRAEGLKFEELLSPIAQSNGGKVSFVTAGKSFLSKKLGPVTQSNNALDVAIKGDGWLSLQTPQGAVYSRDGRMSMNSNGELVSVRGNRYLDSLGDPIQLDPKAGDPIITQDGRIFQNNKPVARLGVYQFPEHSQFSYREGSSVVADKNPILVEDFKDVGIMQGFVEASNVNGVIEMTRLIEVSRAFERMEHVLRTQDTQSEQTLRAFGSQKG